MLPDPTLFLSGDWATFFFTNPLTFEFFSTALREGLAPYSLLPLLFGSSRPVGKPPLEEERRWGRVVPRTGVYLAQELCVFFFLVTAGNSRACPGQGGRSRRLALTGLERPAEFGYRKLKAKALQGKAKGSLASFETDSLPSIFSKS